MMMMMHAHDAICLLLLYAVRRGRVIAAGPGAPGLRALRRVPIVV